MFKVNYAKDRLFQIDILRAISMLWIVGYWHLFNYTEAFSYYDNNLTKFVTYVALGLFVFISGYLIGVKEEFRTVEQVKKFLVKKIFRIYPLYAVALLITSYRGPDSSDTIVKGLGLISMFWKPAPLTFWFISMIINFYLFSIFWLQFLLKTKKINQFKHYLLVNNTSPLKI
ncbi:acyltransferase family protein [Synechocystis salina LEGE 06099]|uniref:acyltransferase family protein n=1 Tax=Synechocystis salina TaxID=945780 RepID=UPI0018818D8E|nr:acyltransferase family protein [Synechocystis salina]MBE9203854.1 acyltransferase family protein [Synechocystis salina LEGE 06099]